MRLPGKTDARPWDGRAILATSVALVGFAYVTSRAYFLGETDTSVAALAWGGALALAVLASLVVHRFAHVVVARRAGVASAAFDLLPVGGRSDGRDTGLGLAVEIRIALAGPAAHGLLALATLPFTRMGGVLGTFLLLLTAMNACLALANLLPAPPLDGARILRAVARTRMPRRGPGVVEVFDRALPAAFGPLSVMSLGTGSWILLSLVAFLFLSANVRDPLDEPQPNGAGSRLTPMRGGVGRKPA